MSGYSLVPQTRLLACRSLVVSGTSTKNPCHDSPGIRFFTIIAHVGHPPTAAAAPTGALGHRHGHYSHLLIWIYHFLEC